MKTRIYLSNVSKFIGEKLEGNWIELPLPVEKLQKEIKALLHDYETYFIIDYIGAIKIEKFADLFELNKFLRRLQKFNEYNQHKICFLLNVIGCYPEEAMKEYKAVDFYPGMSLKDIALKDIKESDIINHKATFNRYINFEKIINDLILDGFYETENGTFWYF